MALPKWITPEGNLGIVPEQEFYSLTLEASDPSGGNLSYYHVSGKLPLGIQVKRSGIIQGVPVSEAGGDQNVEYSFTVRVKNEISFTGSILGNTLTVTAISAGALEIGQTLEKTGILPQTRIVGFLTGSGGAGTYRINQPQSIPSGSFIATSGLSDRTFKLTITNVAPPIINFPPRNSFLGVYLDGSEINLQLEAIEFTPGLDLTWEITDGQLPPGLTMNSSGLITGFIYPILGAGPNTDPGWDDSAWGLQSWDFPLLAISKTFQFTAQVKDGLKYDQSKYTIRVFPKSSLTADSDVLTADLSTLVTNQSPLTVDLGLKHSPIITTKQSEIIPGRQGSFFSLNLEAVDVDSDVVWWSFNQVNTGLFDEQNILGNSPNYIASKLIAARLTAGAFPKAELLGTAENPRINLDYTNVNLKPGDQVKVLNTANRFELGTINGFATIRLLGNSKPVAASGDFITQLSSGANASIAGVSATTGNLQLSGNIFYGNIFTEYPSYQITTSGNISASVGNFITQATTGANAVVISRPGFLIFNDSTELANIQPGDTIFQPSTGANAQVFSTPISFGFANIFYVNYISSVGFAYGSGNVSYIRDGTLTVINNFPTSGNVIANTFSVLYLANTFSNVGNLSVNSVNSGRTPILTVKDTTNRTLRANIGDIITQVGSNALATVAATVEDVVSLSMIVTNSFFVANGGNLRINGNDTNVRVSAFSISSSPTVITANVGDFITQSVSGANAVVTKNIVDQSLVEVKFLSNSFILGSGNIQLNGGNVAGFPTQAFYQTNFDILYNSAATFDINFSELTGQVRINNLPTYSNVIALVDVGVSLLGVINEGDIGFSEGRYDQGGLAFPPGITINQKTGWVTGFLPTLNVNQKDYQFEVVAFKRDDPDYRDSQIFTLTVLGDPNNTINWISPSNLGTLQNGDISDLYVRAEHVSSINPRNLVYELKGSKKIKIPQGLTLLTNGLIIGRVSFQVFALDQNQTTFDRGSTTFDGTYTFTVTARDTDNIVSSDKTFTLRVLGVNTKPYENLYLKPLPSQPQRNLFLSLTRDPSIFPSELIYRREDPWFGVAKDLKILFVPGMNPSSLAEYTQAASTNHFRKNLLFNGIKTARALDENFNVKYEVVYIGIVDQNINVLGEGPANIIDLSQEIINNYLVSTESYNVAYPASVVNMGSVMASGIGYANKGALPDWMTSRQADGRVLGFTRAVVLAYCKPGGAEIVAYRLRQRSFDLTSLDFTIDRYLLENKYSQFYNLEEGKFLLSTETTFDRYVSLNEGNDEGSIDYAVSDPFDLINNQSVETIRANRELGGLGGLDSIKTFRDGQTLVFYDQEFSSPGFIADYNDGWSLVSTIWDFNDWDYDSDVTDLIPGEGWNQSTYVPGYNEWKYNGVTNQRIGVWKINIVNGIVRLSFFKNINPNSWLYVRQGNTHRDTTIFYEDIIQENKNFPSWSKFKRESQNITIFDGGGTRFYDNRDQDGFPEKGDKYIAFTKTGVFK